MIPARRRLVVLFAVAFSIPGFTATALATNFGGPKTSGADCDTSIQSECVANDSTHLICIDGIPTAHRNAVVNRIAHYNGMSFLYAAENPSPCNNADDVIVVDVSLPLTRAYAWTKCNVGASYGGSSSPRPGTRWCKAQQFVWNQAFASFLPTDTNKQMVACHEIGHTLGLRHRATAGPSDPPVQSCMISSRISPSPYINPWTTTDTHDRVHLDARYDAP